MISDIIPRTLIASPDSISTERALKQILELLEGFVNPPDSHVEDMLNASIGDVNTMLRAIQ